MSAALTSNEANTNAGSCGVGCSIISQTLVYHVTCKLQPGTTTTLSVDASAIATGEAGITGRCNPLFEESVSNSGSTSSSNVFTLIGSSYTVFLGTCEANGTSSVLKYCPGGCSSPVIVDVGDEGFHLTDAAHGVLFAADASSGLEQIAWTAPGCSNAFLALPGADGMVHNLSQLFGNLTPQPQSPAPNGFAALGVYDLTENGGNGDGVIDARDAIFSKLRLWIDANHDGISQPEELHTLPSLGVDSISLNYKPDFYSDKYGNMFRYRSRVSGKDVGRTAYDVFFVTQ
jgi:hypothetical protein